MKIDLGQAEEAKFEMAPMIDMVFLLLVFFMMASQMAQLQNVKMEIPEATKAVIPKERLDRWVVNIIKKDNPRAQKDGTNLYIGKDPIQLKELGGLVTQQVKANPKIKIYLRADSNSKHKDVKKVMTEMAKAGVSDFIFGVFVKKE